MTKYPRPCASCYRLLRPQTSAPEDYPTAEAVHQAHGLCQACYSNPNRKPTASYPKPCCSCGVMIRPASAPPEKYPTAEDIHGGHGLCKSCYMHRRNTTHETQLAELQHANTLAGLHRFMARIKGKSRVKEGSHG